MTPELLAVLVPILTAFGAGLVALVKWGVGRIIKAMDDSRTSDGDLREEMGEVRIVLAAMVEQGRIRDTRRRRESSLPPLRSSLPSTPYRPPAETWDEETTNIDQLIEKERAKVQAAKAPVLKRTATPAGGVRPPRKGTHHDGDQ